MLYHRTLSPKRYWIDQVRYHSQGVCVMPNNTTDTITVTKNDFNEDKGRFSTPKNKKGYQHIHRNKR